MTHRLSEHSEAKLLYDLSAVLIHKGAGVNSGHYVAHIKDENTQQWWEFDDEQVSSLGQHPFGEGSSNSTPKPAIEPVVQASCSETADIVMNGNHSGAEELLSTHSDDVNKVQMFSSSESYMLMYTLRRPENVNEIAQVAPSAIAVEKTNSISSGAEFSLPSHLYEEINKLNASYDSSCAQYEAKKKSEMEKILERREEVRSVLSEAPVHSLQEQYFWVCSDWLRYWADNITSS